jgi:hypothetical protein
MGFKYPIGKHVGKDMMAQTFWDGILKLNYLLPDEMFKWKKACELGAVRDHILPLSVVEKGRCYCWFALRL